MNPANLRLVDSSDGEGPPVLPHTAADVRPGQEFCKELAATVSELSSLIESGEKTRCRELDAVIEFFGLEL